jgi:ubiquinone/menaquinone biosynthesis C-methylase UbiE
VLTNEAFYDRLAHFYDIMNDWPARLAYEGTFIRRVLGEHEACSVLDAACGTGWHTLALREWGYEPTGADSSPQMIRRAQTHAASSDIPFTVADFESLPSIPGAPFDAVLCLGNSLPHVESAERLDASLRGMIGALRPSGVLLIHNLNYDKRWIERPRFFKLDSGTLEENEVLVWRMADYGETTITFHTALFQRDERGNWSVEVNSTLQMPLFHDDLVNRLKELGLENVEAFGDLTGGAFRVSSSDDLVLVATKPTRRDTSR